MPKARSLSMCRRSRPEGDSAHVTAAVVCDSQIRALEPLILAVHSLLLHCTAGPHRPLTHVSCVYVRMCLCLSTACARRNINPHQSCIEIQRLRSQLLVSLLIFSGLLTLEV